MYIRALRGHNHKVNSFLYHSLQWFSSLSVYISLNFLKVLGFAFV